MFYIGFTTGPRTDDEGWLHALGGIELGSDSDGFAADLRTWSQRDYERQWREAIARLTVGHSSSALITSFTGPDGGFHSTWPMWREGNTVFIQQRLVPASSTPPLSSPEDFYASIGERHTRSESGEPISEWALPFSDVLAFLTSD